MRFLVVIDNNKTKLYCRNKNGNFSVEPYLTINMIVKHLVYHVNYLYIIDNFGMCHVITKNDSPRQIFDFSILDIVGSKITNSIFFIDYRHHVWFKTNCLGPIGFVPQRNIRSEIYNNQVYYQIVTSVKCRQIQIYRSIYNKLKIIFIDINDDLVDIDANIL